MPARKLINFVVLKRIKLIKAFVFKYNLTMTSGNFNNILILILFAKFILS